MRVLAMPYAGEAEITELKLLMMLADKMVVAESGFTFTGRRRFREEMLPDYLRARVDWRLTITEPLEDAWANEAALRTFLGEQVASMGLPDDALVIYTDADEVPSKEWIDWVDENLPTGQVYRPLMSRRCLYVNWESPGLSPHEQATCAFRLGGLKFASLERIVRGGGVQCNNPDEVGAPLGWHFGWLGGKDRVMTKLKGFAHTELSGLPESEVEARLADGRDLFRREALDTVPVPDSTLPAELLAMKERWPHLWSRSRR